VESSFIDGGGGTPGNPQPFAALRLNPHIDTWSEGNLV
jgi:hypothetical protein